SVPPEVASPRAVLKGFFRAMDEAEVDDRRLQDAIGYLDLGALPAAERAGVGAKLAGKLDAMLRKLEIDLNTIPDSWNAPAQVLGKGRGLRVELVRQREGTWRFSRATVEQVPQLVEQLAALEQSERKRTGHLESARDTMVSFLTAGNHHDDERAARCLDLGDLNPSIRGEAGPVLAYKLRYVIDRARAVYSQ